MKTVNTVVANLERIINFSKAKEESNIYLYWKIGRELSFAYKLNKYGRHFIDDIVYGLQKKRFIIVHIEGEHYIECSSFLNYTQIGRGLVHYYLKSVGQRTF